MSWYPHIQNERSRRLFNRAIELVTRTPEMTLQEIEDELNHEHERLMQGWMNDEDQDERWIGNNY